jgi:hypothetical protein
MFLKAGINNQKIFALGVLNHSMASGVSPKLPDLCNFVPPDGYREIFPFSSRFDVTNLKSEILQFGLHLDENTLDNSCPPPWDLFRNGARAIGRSYRQHGLLRFNTLEATFFSNISPIFDGLENSALQSILYDNEIEICCQLRIEKDWVEYLNKKLGTRMQSGEDSSQDPIAVIKKIKNTFPIHSGKIFVTCDEDNLPLSKSELKELVLRKTNIELVFKSDLLSSLFYSLDSIGRSLLDYELAISASMFVGNSRSSFANLLCYEKVIRTGCAVTGHYIYNMLGDKVIRRVDNGMFPEPEKSASVRVPLQSS